MESDSYILQMKRLATDAFSALHEGVRAIMFADFPDYSNVGDSAIALGQVAFWREAGVRLTSVYTAYSFPESAFDDRHGTVFINGGGSLGGLYGYHNQHRYELAERLSSETLLIQGPQSVHFPGEEHRREFLERMAPRRHMRIAVRDEASVRELQGDVDVLLTPDAAHLLGPLPSQTPNRRRVILARKDKESDAAGVSPTGAVDWVGGDTWYMQTTRTLNEQAHRIPGGSWLTRPAPSHWIRRAEQRLKRGIRLLGPAETVVTDRLHGMLLALQMGKRVVAVDNNNHKLSAYAETWFGYAQPEVTFAKTLNEALELS